MWGYTIQHAMHHMQGNHLHLLLIIRCVYLHGNVNCTQCSVSYSSICESQNQLCTCKHLQLNHSREIVSLQLLSKKWNHPASILVYDCLPWWQNSRHCLRSNSCRRLTAKTTCSLWCSQRCVLQLRTGHETGRQLRSGSLHVTGFKTG